MIISVHQPNYMPWLGYFHKIAIADVFVFLDNVQYSKNSYINRVKVFGPSGPKWLTVPVTYDYGNLISQVQPAFPDWRSSHLDTLFNTYRSAPSFNAVWPQLTDLYQKEPQADLASINRVLVEGIANALGLRCRFMVSSSIPTRELTSDDRIVALVASIDSNGTYLSGIGGAGYQDHAKFTNAGLQLQYTEFEHPQYDQGRVQFTESLSILDALFNLGWSGTADLFCEDRLP
jgi:hypothetical protein